MASPTQGSTYESIEIVPNTGGEATQLKVKCQYLQFFENLTLAPIEKDLINYDLLNSSEINYLFKYHLTVYTKISKYLNSNEKKWLASFI